MSKNKQQGAYTKSLFTNSDVAGYAFRKSRSRVRALVGACFCVVHLGTDCIEGYRHSGTPVMAPAPTLPLPATAGGYRSPQSVHVPSSASSSSG